MDRWVWPLQTDVVPVTSYARSGEVNIVYQAFGGGPVVLVFVPGVISHLELGWEEPCLARFLRRLAAFSRVIFFDKRTGLPESGLASIWQVERVGDIWAVTDAVGSRRAAVFGVCDGGCLCIAFAVGYPERSASLVTCGSFARRLRSAGYPWGWSAGHLEEVLRGWIRAGPAEVAGRGKSRRGRRRALPGMVGSLPASPGSKHRRL